MHISKEETQMVEILLNRFTSMRELIPKIQNLAIQGFKIEKDQTKQNKKIRDLERTLLETIGKIIQGKWKGDILFALVHLDNPSYNEIKREINGIGSRILTDRLKEFEKLNIVRRTEISQSPIQVEYDLTKLGWGVVCLLQPLVLFLLENKIYDK